MPIFTNQATLSYNNTSTNSNVVTGNIVEALSASKNAVVATYQRGDTITYVISIINSSSQPYTDVTLRDNLGAYTFGTQTLVPLTYVEGSVNYYLNGVLQPSPTVSVVDGFVIENLTIPANSTALFIYEAEANEFAPLNAGASITNIATINGENIIEEITVTETVIPQSTPILSITKSLSPTTVSENSEITYTFVIQNNGNIATIDDDELIVTDVFSPALRNITVTYNGNVLQEGVDYTYQNGVFTTLPGVVNVPAATYSQDLPTGTVIINPGASVITVTGTI